jgi:hypothetical protein
VSRFNDESPEITIERKGPRFVIRSRGDSFFARDSRGHLWTVYLPSACAWKTREAAETFARAEGLSDSTVEDVTGWLTAPLFASEE